MVKDAVIAKMERHRLVAVVRSKSADEALAIARAVADGGVWFVEITLTVPGALAQTWLRFSPPIAWGVPPS